MNKAELVDKIADKTGVNKSDTEQVLDGLFACIVDHVTTSEDKINITGWISFQQNERSARTGRNPQTGETMQIAAKKVIQIKQGAKLKNAFG